MTSEPLLFDGLKNRLCALFGLDADDVLGVELIFEGKVINPLDDDEQRRVFCAWISNEAAIINYSAGQIQKIKERNNQ